MAGRSTAGITCRILSGSGSGFRSRSRGHQAKAHPEVGASTGTGKGTGKGTGTGTGICFISLAIRGQVQRLWCYGCSVADASLLVNQRVG